jgi:hypothetical protein
LKRKIEVSQAARQTSEENREMQGRTRRTSSA